MIIKILSAGSLKPFFDKLTTIYNQMETPIDFKVEYTGSLECIRKIYKGHEIDIVAVADYSLLGNLVQERIISDYRLLAGNEMVLCFTDKSKYAHDVNESNWFQYLVSDHIKVGHTSPDLDPAGYRTLLVMKLAQKYYAQNELFTSFMSKEKRQVFTNASLMVNQLIEGNVDYIFEYYSVAKNNNLNFIKLPNEINLSTFNEPFYANATVAVQSYKDGNLIIYGAPIAYAFGILPREENYHVEKFANFMQSTKAQELLNLYNLNPLFKNE